MGTALQSQLVLLSGAHLWADFEDEQHRNAYRDRLAEPVRLEQSLPDILGGIQGKRQATVRIKNVATQGVDGSGGGQEPGDTDLTLADLEADGVGLHGQPASVRLADLDTGASYLAVSGTISDVDAASGDVTIEELDAGVLQIDIPKRRVLDLFPEADLTRAPGNDPRLIKPFGVMRQVQLACVSADRKDWGAVIVPATGTLTWNTVYRNKAVAVGTDYSIVTIGDVRIVRFVRGQPEDVEIRADLTSTEFANHADVAKWILSNVTDGLGQGVDAAGFATASAALATAGYVVGHGIGPEPVRAEEILNELAVRGSVIARTDGGGYTWIVDHVGLHTTPEYQGTNYELGRGDGRWENILRVTSSRQKRIEERIRDYTLLGLYSAGFGNDAYLLRARSSRTSTGTITTVTNRYIGDLPTLQAECGYRMTRLQAEHYGLSLEVSPEARRITINQQVAVTVPHLRIGPTNPPYPLIAKRIVGSRGTWTIDLVGYDAAQYTALAAETWAAATASQLTDYTFTYPAVPTAFALVGAATVLLGDQGKSTTYQVVQATAPAANVTHLVFRLVRNGQALPGPEFERPATPSQTVQAEVQAESGLVYTIEYFARNKANDPAFADGQIGQYINYTAAGDSTAPAQVTGLSLGDQPPRGIKASWTNSANIDIQHYRVDVALDAGFSSGLTTRYVKSNEIIIPNLSPGTTYFVRIRAEDWSNNLGSFSGTASWTSPRVITNDIGDLQVTGAKTSALFADRITTGLLTVNPTSGGATAIFVDNAGKIRLKSIVGVPARIDFEDSAGSTRAYIAGKPSDLSILPQFSNDIGLELGDITHKYVDIIAQCTNVFGITADRVVINGTLAGCNPTAITPTNLSAYNAKAYLTLISVTGSVYGLIPII